MSKPKPTTILLTMRSLINEAYCAGIKRGWCNSRKEELKLDDRIEEIKQEIENFLR